MRELFLKDKKIRLIMLFIVSTLIIIFGMYNILFVASETSLVCLSDSKTCIFEDRALLKKEFKELNFNQILDARVTEHCSSKYGCDYTTQLITNEKSYDIKKGKSQTEEKAYADAINLFIRSQNSIVKAVAGDKVYTYKINGVTKTSNTPTLIINYNDWYENFFLSLILIIVCTLLILYGIWRFNINSIF